MHVVRSKQASVEKNSFIIKDFLTDNYAQFKVDNVDIELAFLNAIHNLFVAYLNAIYLREFPHITKRLQKHVFSAGRLFDFIELILRYLSKATILIDRHKVANLIKHPHRLELKDIFLDNFFTEDSFPAWQKYLLDTKTQYAVQNELSYFQLAYLLDVPPPFPKYLHWGIFLWLLRHQCAYSLPQIKNPNDSSLILWFLQNSYLLCNCINCVNHVIGMPPHKAATYYLLKQYRFLARENVETEEFNFHNLVNASLYKPPFPFEKYLELRKRFLDWPNK